MQRPASPFMRDECPWLKVVARAACLRCANLSAASSAASTNWQLSILSSPLPLRGPPMLRDLWWVTVIMAKESMRNQATPTAEARSSQKYEFLAQPMCTAASTMGSLPASSCDNSTHAMMRAASDPMPLIQTFHLSSQRKTRTAPNVMQQQHRPIERDAKRVREFSAFSPAVVQWYLLFKLQPHLNAGHPAAWPLDAALLFVDISGFTNLCTRLEIDVLQAHINCYFTQLIDIVHGSSGDVLRFAGDAILCAWFIRDDTFDVPHALQLAMHAACRCALKLIDSCAEYPIPELDATLSVHCGIAAGGTHSFHVGDPTTSEYFLSGSTVRDVAAAESLAAHGEVIAVILPCVPTHCNASFVLTECCTVRCAGRCPSRQLAPGRDVVQGGAARRGGPHAAPPC